MNRGLTFVVPARNAEGTLADTLASVLGQASSDVQCVVVDDGSTDGTGEIARSFQSPRLRLVRQRTAGLAGARNAGLHEVSTDLVCFLDGDDVVAPEYVERMGVAIGSHDLVACPWSFVGPGLEDLGWTCEVLAQDGELSRLIEVNPFGVGCIVHRTGSLLALASNDASEVFDTSLAVLEDWDLLLRLARAGASWAPPVGEPLFRYRLRAGSMSSDLSLMHETAIIVQSRHACAFGPSHDADRRHRDLTLRSLARAVAQREQNLVSRWSGEIRSLEQRDEQLFAGALRIAFGRADGVCPRDLSREAWQARIAQLPFHPECRRRLLDLVAGDDALRRATTQLLEMSSSNRVVLVGMGRNGRSLADALCGHERGGRIAWIDDAPSATAPASLPRIAFDQLERADIVIITPDDPRDLASRASDRGVAMVIPLSRLAQDATLAGEVSPP